MTVKKKVAVRSETVDTRSADAVIGVSPGSERLVCIGFPSTPITWTKPPTINEGEDLDTINARFTRRASEMLRQAERNTRRLTGKPRL